jgi:hypothetical protein
MPKLAHVAWAVLSSLPMRLQLGFLGSVGLALAITLATPRAEACGGCFPPPGEQQSVVTDHRMVLSVSKTQSTLYDQIQYSGNPSSFAWVLPISGTVDVGLSADSLFAGLHNLSAVVVQEPPRNCPARPTCDDEKSFADGAPTASDAGSAGGVSVLKKEVVGPYETVQLKSTDPAELNNWLTQNGFNIPEDIKPTIAQYVAEKFNFLALKLQPGQGINSMRPVRVTTQGASPVLPLRMVAAGTGANVGITLWVVAEGRYEPTNFPTFTIENKDLIWDWNAGTSNYKDLRAQRAATQPGKMWEVESSITFNRVQLQNVVRNVLSVTGQQGGDYLADDSGTVKKTADQVREADLATVFAGIPQGSEHLTRLRSDLSRAALATDLVVGAAQSQDNLQTVRIPANEVGQPQCPIYNGCNAAGTLPRDQAKAHAQQQSGEADTFTCQSSGMTGAGLGGYGAVASFLALACLRSARERRRRASERF